MRNGLLLWLVLLLAPACWGPGGTYCQTGPKYGTQCYAQADVEAEQRSQGRMPPPEDGSRRWNARLAPPSSSSARVSSAASSGPAPLAVTVQFVHAAPREEQIKKADVSARTRATEQYAQEIAEWLSEYWVRSAEAAGADVGSGDVEQLPCAEERFLEASVKVRVDQQGRVEGWDWLQRPLESNFEMTLETALAELVARTLPSPPAVFSDVRPRVMDAVFSNRGFACGKSARRTSP